MPTVIEADPVTALLLAVGAAAAVVLLTSLIGAAIDPRLRIWPAPPARSWQSFVFWLCFRVLNAAVIAIAIVALLAAHTSGKLSPVQGVLAALSALIFAGYLYALWSLGKPATYCEASGLNTRGIYQWSRNPQYAMAILAYAILASSAATPPTAILALALIGVYALMAMSEEPWLRQTYGSAYAQYARDVPRFFNVQKAIASVYGARVASGNGIEGAGQPMNPMRSDRQA